MTNWVIPKRGSRYQIIHGTFNKEVSNDKAVSSDSKFKVLSNLEGDSLIAEELIETNNLVLSKFSGAKQGTSEVPIIQAREHLRDFQKGLFIFI